MKMAGFALVTSMMLPDVLGRGDCSADQDLAWMAVERNSRSTDINARAEAIRAMRFAAGRPTAQVLQDSLRQPVVGPRHAIIGLVLAGDEGPGPCGRSLRNQSIPLEAEALELSGIFPCQCRPGVQGGPAGTPTRRATC